MTVHELITKLASIARDNPSMVVYVDDLTEIRTIASVDSQVDSDGKPCVEITLARE